jgi:hypothetical protein
MRAILVIHAILRIVNYDVSWNEKYWKMVESFMKILLSACCTVPFLIAIDFILNPWSALYPTSHWVDSPYRTVVWLIFAYFYGKVCILTLSSCAYPIAILIPLMTFADQVLTKMKFTPERRSQPKSRTRNDLRIPDNIIHLYRTIALIDIKLNDGLGSFMMLTYSINSYLAIIIFYILIRHHDMLDIGFNLCIFIFGFNIILVWVVILQTGGTTFKRSKSCIENWRKSIDMNWNDFKLMRKFSKSCKPMGLKFGSFYTVRLVRVLQFINFLIWGTVRALVIF